MKVEMVLDEKGRKGKRGQCLSHPRIFTYAPKSQIATNKFMRGKSSSSRYHS